ncbi:MAG: hypothetical protein Q8K65_06740 [Alphaproteobacteria bacterium]|nr:hypothetical protein [Alphaproteobacteria bacterium]
MTHGEDEKMKEEMQHVVGKTMRDTFEGMFGWPVQSAAGRPALPLDAPVRSHVLLRESEAVSVDVVLDFDHRLLSLAGAKIYPEDMQGSPEMYADMAAEIANIVAGGIKAYLNNSGHSLRMVSEAEAPPPTSGTPSVDVSFQYDNGGTPKPLGIVVRVNLKDFSA